MNSSYFGLLNKMLRVKALPSVESYYQSLTFKWYFYYFFGDFIQCVCSSSPFLLPQLLTDLPSQSIPSTYQTLGRHLLLLLPLGSVCVVQLRLRTSLPWTVVDLLRILTIKRSWPSLSWQLSRANTLYRYLFSSVLSPQGNHTSSKDSPVLGMA